MLDYRSLLTMKELIIVYISTIIFGFCAYFIIRVLLDQCNYLNRSVYYYNNKHKSKHLWGYADTEFKCLDNESVVLTGKRYVLCGKEFPNFIPFIRKKIGNINVKNSLISKDMEGVYIWIRGAGRPDIEHFKYNFCNNIKMELSYNSEDRLLHSHGQLSVDEIYELMYGTEKFNTVDVVVYPRTNEDLNRLFEIANREYENEFIDKSSIIDGNKEDRYRIKLIPYGGGTNVTGCLKLSKIVKNELYVSVDMKHFNKVISVDEENYVAVLGAGMTGKSIEKSLNKMGFTMGHEPDSYEFSTLGGWISTYASGMKRAKYGNIEDIVIGFEGYCPKGYFNCHHLTSAGKNVIVRSSQGIDPKMIFFGSEGNLGIITHVTVNIKKLPSVKKYQSVVFKNMNSGVDFLMELYDSEAVPASIRLVDNNQFHMGQALKPKKGSIGLFIDKLTKFYLKYIKRFDYDTMVAATIVFEGSYDTVAYQEYVINKLTKKYGGIIGGSENGKVGYLLTSCIAYIRDFVNSFNIIAETFETSCAWSDIIPMTEEMKTKLIEMYIERKVKIIPFMTFRITQLYNSGACLYFTLAVYDPDRSVNICDVYKYVEEEMRKIMSKYSTSVSHHHGIGKLKKNLLLTDSITTDALLKMKNTLDPINVMSTGNGIFE